MHFIMQYELGLIWTHWNQHGLIRKVQGAARILCMAESLETLRSNTYNQQSC